LALRHGTSYWLKSPVSRLSLPRIKNGDARLFAVAVGAAGERLKPLFDNFRSWLLGHDSQRTLGVFAAESELGAT
jgi:hypothetical protein